MTSSQDAIDAFQQRFAVDPAFVVRAPGEVR